MTESETAPETEPVTEVAPDDKRPTSGRRGRPQHRGTPDGPRRPTAADGLLVVDKPAGMTSHDVVSRLRRLASTKKVGHAGTLDPMATGVLVLGIGRATKLLTWVVGADKDYSATIRLGVTTSTDDADGDVVTTPGAASLDPAALQVAVAALTGPISQVPSSVSAIKVDGRRAYDIVRSGEEVELAARDVVVSDFTIAGSRPSVVDGVEVVDLDVQVTCSSGTYIRALARDLGAALGTGGHLTALRRTRVGAFSEVDAATLEGLDLTPMESPIEVISYGAGAAMLFDHLVLTADQERELGFGRPIALEDGQQIVPASSSHRGSVGADRSASSGSGASAGGHSAGRHPSADASLLAALTEDGRMVALLDAGDMRRLRPVMVVPT